MPLAVPTESSPLRRIARGFLGHLPSQPLHGVLRIHSRSRIDSVLVSKIRVSAGDPDPLSSIEFPEVVEIANVVTAIEAVSTE